MEAVRALVELRGADLDQFHEGRVESVARGGIKTDQGLEGLRGGLGEIDPGAADRRPVRGVVPLAELATFAVFPVFSTFPVPASLVCAVFVMS